MIDEEGNLVHADSAYKSQETEEYLKEVNVKSKMNNALNLTSIGIERIKSTIELMNLTYNLVRYEQMVRLQKVKLI